LHFEALAWSAFVKEVPVKLALTTASNWRSTRPILVALKHAGVKTALWHYSANSVRFHHPGGRRNSNGRFKAFHEADRIYVWNPQAERWIHRYLSHSVENQLRVVGPVMCGDAGLCLNTRPSLDPRLRVSIFDVSMPEGGSNSRTGSLHLPESFYSAFWSDVHRLAHEFSDWVLLLKPKKSLQSSRRASSDEFQKLFNDEMLKQAGRIETVAADADPYMAISQCDAAIVMPFTSPGQAVMHFGKAGIYYDPTGIVGLHHHADLGRFFCRSYDELAGLIRELARAKSAGTDSLLPEKVASFTGRVPGSDPQQVFLRDLAEWIGVPIAASSTRTAKSGARELVSA
jgi:polysaccharide biosynthesis PFTS motif protein